MNKRNPEIDQIRSNSGFLKYTRNESGKGGFPFYLGFLPLSNVICQFGDIIYEEEANLATKKQKEEQRELMKNYVIYTEQGYVKYAQITDNEGHVAVWKALYTSNLKY
ncbi:hypothetical protein [Fictibacillus sp. KU28468]|uniref:hypothetical protein n=1 Tax=Fictibacillus sp. KU28468 TaxID=2991053 RepID=UPI00223D4500|nr:hypothetical protein [Fictibacillus sp. KU28468]UZJ80509.1 hypothetical protein OKX00_08665 [Fictibacillus sp. KU28468]